VHADEVASDTAAAATSLEVLTSPEDLALRQVVALRRERHDVEDRAVENAAEGVVVDDLRITRRRDSA
jgi:hypothetical protein